MKKLVFFSGMLSGFCFTFMTLWAWTMLDAGAVIFWSVVGSIACGAFLLGIAEEIEACERAKISRRRKHQIYEVR